MVAIIHSIVLSFIPIKLYTRSFFKILYIQLKWFLHGSMRFILLMLKFKIFWNEIIIIRSFFRNNSSTERLSGWHITNLQRLSPS